MKIDKIVFSNFTSFDQLNLAFSPHINVITGMNGVGKTNIVKYLYCLLQTLETIRVEETNSLSVRVTKSRSREMLAEKLAHVYRPNNGLVGRMAKRVRGISNASVTTYFDNKESINVSFSSHAKNSVTLDKDVHDIGFDAKSVFIPPKEIISATENFYLLYEKYHIAFEETYADLSKLLLMPLQSQETEKPTQKSDSSTKYGAMVAKELNKLLKGEVKVNENRFSLKTKGIGEIEMGLLAEGYRKLSTLAQLVGNEIGRAHV